VQQVWSAAGLDRGVGLDRRVGLTSKSMYTSKGRSVFPMALSVVSFCRFFIFLLLVGLSRLAAYQNKRVTVCWHFLDFLLPLLQAPICWTRYA